MAKTDKKTMELIATVKAQKAEIAKLALSVETVPDFTWDSYTAAEWIQDFRTRINKVQIATKREKLSKLEERLKNATKREKLSKLEERLKKIISPELQAELELEAIESELK